MPRGNTQNLKSQATRTKEEQKKIARLGGLKSGESRRKKAKLKELLELYLSMPDKETGEENDIAMVAALIKKAISGDVKAFEVIRDTIGQKPKEEKEVNIKTPLNIDIAKIKEINDKIDNK